jgi:hypothetical protein
MAPLEAALSPDSRGTASVAFLSMAADARAAGLGNAMTAIADDATAMNWNPAGMLQIESMSASLMQAAYVGDSRFGSASFGGRFLKDWAAGFSYRQMTAGTVQRTDESGNDLGSFRPMDFSAGAGMAWRSEENAVGAVVKRIQSQLEDKASTWAMDFGFRSKPFRDDRVALGLALRNVGGKIKYQSATESLPTVVSGGLSFQARKDWLLVAEMNLPSNDQAAVALAAEHAQRLTSTMSVFGRFGYNTSQGRSADGFSAGMGALVSAMRLDYALNLQGSSNRPTHIFSLSYAF